MKKGTIQVISFISGLTLTAVVVGVTISKSPSIRKEIESQLNSCLKATRALADTYKSVASKTKSAVNLIKKDAGEKTEKETAAEEEVREQVSSQWNAVEAQAQ